MPSVARVRWARFRVTVVAVVSILILGTLLYALFGGIYFSPKITVYLYIPDASGLSHESPVRVDGINVGRVSSVALSGSNNPDRTVKVTLLLYRSLTTGIPADSLAQISSDTLIGDKFVDITSGTNLNPVPASGEILYKYQPELLRSLDLTEFTKQLRQVDAMLADIESGRNAFGQFYHGDRFYNDLIRRLRQLHEGFRGATSATSMVGGMLSNDLLFRQVNGMLVKLNNSVAQVQSGQGRAGQLLRDSAQYDQLVSQAQAFRRSLASVEKSGLLQSDSAWENANRALAGMTAKVDDFNRRPEMNTTATYDELNGSLQQLRDNLKDFRLNPRKYLRMRMKIF